MAPLAGRDGVIAFPQAWLNAVTSTSARLRDRATRLLLPKPAIPADAEWVELPDGTRAFIYPLPRDAGAALAAGLQQLSPASRYQRFLSARERFTAAELEFLTNCDGVQHLALVLAVLPARRGSPVPVAVARAIRDFEEPELAEVAVAVADRWQGRGVGRALIRELHARTWSAGIRRWRAYLRADNHPMSRLLSGAGKLHARRFDGPGCVEAIYSLREPEPCPLAAQPADTPSAFPPARWLGVPAAALLVTGGVVWWKKSRTGGVPAAGGAID
jgi:GNAT superfamily N-acetyltransferase